MIIENLEFYIVLAASLMLLSVFSSKISDKFGIPTLFIFLGLGMLAGSDGILGIHFDNPNLAQSIGTLALIFILFGGGIDTSWKAIKPVLKEGLLLSTIGVLLTALLTAVCAYYLFDVSMLEALLMGAIISSTDAAAVFAILRAKGISLKRPLAPLLELESGSNDPMAIFLTLTILQLIFMPEGTSFFELISSFVLQFLIGGLMGYLFGILLPAILNRLHLSYYGLYPVFSIAWILLLFGATALLGGNGFLAVYIAGIAANAREFTHKKNLVGFHDGLAWIMQIWVFLTLGLLVFPSELPTIAWQSVTIALWLTFIARPISVFLTLVRTHLNLNEKLFIAWVGLRGAVPIVLATYPFLKGLEHSSMIFNTVFLVVLISLLMQGMSLPWVARFLGVEESVPAPYTAEVPSSPLFYAALKQLYVQKGAEVIGKSLAELELPSEFLIVLIDRQGKSLKPTGSTLFQENDLLLIYCDSKEHFDAVSKRFKSFYM
ncbi:potassium/proton antiporter [Sulfurospirillum multivorans]|nr:potassium/proton antiporter [Sulfurospirillum multivorans]